MSTPSYENVHPLIERADVSGRTITVRFACPVSGETVDARHSMPRDNSVGGRVSSQVKRNLMVFIRPRILHDQKLMDDLTAGKYRTIRGSQLEQRAGRSVLSRREETPLLPELEDFLQTGQGASEPDGR